MAKNHFEYIVIGASLSGLIVSRLLSDKSNSVALIDAGAVSGGCLAVSETNSNSAGYVVLPKTDLAVKAVEFLEKVNGESIPYSIIEKTPATYSAGELEDFIGFGDKTPDYYREIANFIQPHQIEIDLVEIAQKLFSKFSGTYLNRSVVTQLRVSEQKVIGLQVNGQKEYTADHIVFAGALKDLSPLLAPHEGLMKFSQKIQAKNFATALSLELSSKEHFVDSKAVHVLQSTGQEDKGVYIGEFYSQSEGIQKSKWITFLSSDETEDIEQLGTAARRIKRQIKRVYPQFFDSPITEKIVVHESNLGSVELKLTGQQEIPKLKSLSVASAQAHAAANFVGAILQAELVAAALGVHPDNTHTLHVNTEEVLSL